jgi:hypothetical protein
MASVTTFWRKAAFKSSVMKPLKMPLRRFNTTFCFIDTINL